MSTVYSIYKQIHAPTGIELSIYCNLIHPTEKCLVIAGVNQLHVYRLSHEGPAVDSTTSQNGVAGRGEKAGTAAGMRRVRFECITSFQLFGNIVSMQAVRLSNSTHDALLLSFRDAKLSLVEYDPSTHDLKTLSLHYFEDDEFKDGRCQHMRSLPIVHVDTDARCAAMLTFSRRLVILPFLKADIASVIPAVDDPLLSGASSTGQTQQILSSYVIDLHKMDERIVNVLDFQFLYGYHEPTTCSGT